MSFITLIFLGTKQQQQQQQQQFLPRTKGSNSILPKDRITLSTQDLAFSPNTLLLSSFRESMLHLKFPGFMKQVGLQTEFHYDLCHIYAIDFLQD